VHHHPIAGSERPSAEHIADLMRSVLSDGLDHPELWTIVPEFVQSYPELIPVLRHQLDCSHDPGSRMPLLVLLGIAGATLGDPRMMLDILLPMTGQFGQSPLVQGAIFHLEGLLDPENPKYRLADRLCTKPFVKLDVLENSTHQCCASWLTTSAGNLQTTPWEQVWNGVDAQAVRASMLDGSFRHCNKRTCPSIQSDDLPTRESLRADSFWREIIEAGRTAMPRGPETVNLAYDRTCNLSCPSCRTERFAADEATRLRFDEMQDRAILPLLKHAKTVFVTGSGDPFASKNFRRLMHQLTEKEFPQLKFVIMTNGMLFTPAQWEAFPTLHNRVEILRISVDAATGPTHELLRRGARWPVMLENMTFAGDLRAAGLIDDYELVFTVQSENYREVGDAVDLAHEVGANGVYFGRMTNWGTFSEAEYRSKAVFLPEHPEHRAFVEKMQDPRLRDPMVLLGDLTGFVREPGPQHRAFKF